MPELPEIVVLSEQMSKEILGKKVHEVEVRQPKNLNIPVEEFVMRVVGSKILSIKPRGKWLFIELSGRHYLLINLGMGADLIYFKSEEDLPKTYKFKINFTDGSGFTIDFSWFGYIHLADVEGIKEHKMTRSLGLSPLDEEFTLGHLKKLLRGRKGSVKSFLLNQHQVAGIGNVYIQDILFKARLHPNRNVGTLTDNEVDRLHNSMREVLTKSIKIGGLAYEKDFYGKKGGFSEREFLVGYKTGKPCPVCKTPIEKIRTGSTSSYICPHCQKIEIEESSS